MHTGGRAFHRVHRAAVRINTNVRFHAEVPTAVFVCAAHSGGARLVFVLGAGRGVDDGGVNDGATLEDQTLFTQVGIDLGKQRIRQLVGFEQTVEVEDGGFVQDFVIDQLQTGITPQGGDVIPGFHHSWVRVAEPVLQHVDPQGHGQRPGRASTFHSNLRVVRFNRSGQPIKGNNLFRFRKKSLFLGCLAHGQKIPFWKNHLHHGGHH